MIPSQLTSHLTSAWKVKVSLDVYSKSYETRVLGNFCPESRKENQKGLYRCAIDFQLTLVSFPVSRATSPDLQSARVAPSQVTGILVVRQKKARPIYIVFQVHCNILLDFYISLEKAFFL